MGITSSSSSSPQSSTASYSQRQQNNKRSILLIDDEPDIIGIFKIDLEDNGFKVDAYIDPQKALSSFKAGIYDMIWYLLTL